ncbi:MAG: hypothetical protein HYW07_15600 [Candidatus Latescibacteria bacterium]|nr:hypothetical protein [Candidatus Latescibacterota bacterium]
MLKTVFAIGILFIATGIAYPQSPLLPKKLAIYYGWPSGVNKAHETSGSLEDKLNAATAQFKDYDLVVFSGTLEFPQYTGAVGQMLDGCSQNSHPDHDKTVEIIRRLKTPPNNTAVYGYVTIGGERTNRRCSPDGPRVQLTIDEVRSRVDDWAAMGVVGIFLDEAGYDFGCSRQRQNTVVDYIHSKGLSAFINAWNPEEVFDSTAKGKVVYYYPPGTVPSIYDPLESSAAMNPQGLPTRLGPNDIYLHESFQIINNNYQDAVFWKERSDKALNYKNQFGTRMATVTTMCTPQTSICDPPRTECGDGRQRRGG